MSFKIVNKNYIAYKVIRVVQKLGLILAFCIGIKGWVYQSIDKFLKK